MKITFILGNGFDIQLGLKTSYADFLREYIEPLPTDSPAIDAFKADLANGENMELWSDAETAMGIHLGQFSDDNIDTYSEELSDFEEEMINYLLNQQSQCSFAKQAEIRKIFLSFLTESFKESLNHRGSELDTSLIAEPHTYQFVTFNYTNLLENIIKCCNFGSNKPLTHSVPGKSFADTLGGIYHVHGTLDSQIIMGVNDESQLDLSGGVTLTEDLQWELIKPRINRESRNNWDIPAKRAISGSGIIAIYGVSFGATDNMWWAEIRNWLKASANHKLVAFVRDTKATFNKRIPWQEINYDRRRRAEVLQKLHFEPNTDEFEQLIDQIYIVLNTPHLELKELLLGSRPAVSAV